MSYSWDDADRWDVDPADADDDLAEPTVWPCRPRPGCGCAGLIDCPGPT